MIARFQTVAALRAAIAGATTLAGLESVNPWQLALRNALPPMTTAERREIAELHIARRKRIARSAN